LVQLELATGILHAEVRTKTVYLQGFDSWGDYLGKVGEGVPEFVANLLVSASSRAHLKDTYKSAVHCTALLTSAATYYHHQ